MKQRQEEMDELQESNMFAKMPKFSEETKNISAGRWEWNNETLTVEFLSSSPPDNAVVRKRRLSDINFSELLQKSEWLAETYTVNHRGRQSTRKSLNPTQLSAYRSMVMQSQGDHVTLDDVKQVAVSLLQEKYSLPIPHCFLTLLKREQLDEVLSSLLLYLCCFFEHKSLEKKPESWMVLDIVTESQMMAQTLAKRDLAKKKLAVSYFSLIMDLESRQNQHKGRMTSDPTEWLLEAVLYSFFCYVAWVAFGRKYLKDIQDEIGYLLYSDNFNSAVKTKNELHSRTTSTVSNGSGQKTVADPKQMGRNSTFKRRSTHRPISSIVNQKSPLMVSLLPSPKEQSPHLFLSHQVRPENLPQTKLSDTKALMEELSQQLSSMSIGILGQPLKQFNPVTLIHHEEQSRNKERDKASVNDGQSER